MAEKRRACAAISFVLFAVRMAYYFCFVLTVIECTTWYAVEQQYVQ